VASNKQQIQWKEVKETTGKLGNGQLLSGRGFVQNIPSLSRDRRIKMEQTNKSKKVKIFFRKNIHFRENAYLFRKFQAIFMQNINF